MRIIRCDFCGADIVNGGDDHVIPSDNGWCTVNGKKIDERWEKDICPMCMPAKKDKPMEQPLNNRERFKEATKKQEEQYGS